VSDHAGPGPFDSWLQAVVATLCLLMLVGLVAAVIFMGATYSALVEFRNVSDGRADRRELQNTALICRADVMLGMAPKGTPCPTVPPLPTTVP
jgi:type IV secretory pathway VirB6-like protein